MKMRLTSSIMTSRSVSQTQVDIYEGDNAYRSSDHDPIIVGLDLANPQGDKGIVAAELSALLPSGDKATDRRVARAVDYVDDSLNADWWTSDQAIINHKVLDFERTAIVQLQLVLANADRQLAQIELIAAINRGGDASKISEAEAAMAEATELAASGLLNQAVNAYRAASKS